MSKRAVAILETMWDWRGMTSGAGYNQAPRFFTINPDNFTGRRLYQWLGDTYDHLTVTNACKELVTGPEHHGTPDRTWLKENLSRLPCGLLLVCGQVAQKAYDYRWIPSGTRIIELPHPAARLWDRASLDMAGWHIREGQSSLHMRVDRGQLVVRTLQRHQY